jgi:hypothetical protein
MLFTNILTYAMAFASATPMVAALYNWDPVLQVYTLGEIAADSPKTPRASAKWMGECNGGDIDDGGYGCGSFLDQGTVIYKCVKTKDGSYWLKKHEVCAWVNKSGGGRCVKNQLKKGAKFYPFVSGSKVVCVQPVAVFGHS